MKRENMIIAVKDLTLRKESLKNLGLPGFDWSLSFFVERNRETGYNHIWWSTSTIKMARYSFSGSIPPKFEHKLLRHGTKISGKITTTIVLDKDEKLL